MDKHFDDIFQFVHELEIIDTHEHLPYKESARNKDTDVLKEYLIQYFGCDLISAGLKIEHYTRIINGNQPVVEKWDLVAPYWEDCQWTGYGRALQISVKELYGIEKIERKSIEELNEQFLKSIQPGHYEKVLKQKSKIKISILDSNLDCDKKYFRSVYCIDDFVKPLNKDFITALERKTHQKICCFEDWLHSCQTDLEQAIENGAVGFKCTLAYARTLKFSRVTRQKAEQEFNQIFKLKHIPDWCNPGILISEDFQNYMMHFVLNYAQKKKLPLQIHTGLQEGNGNFINHSDPTLLSNLFLEYPDIKFIIFHIGYPFQHLVTVLAKNNPNVYLDMSWAHIISPNACINALVEWIDTVPLNKICAFGGDFRFIDGVYGHQYLARVNISRALAIKVKEKLFPVETAKKIAQNLFYHNPCAIYQLENIF